MAEEDVNFIEQMTKSMEKLADSLEDFFKKRDVGNFNKTKKTMLDIQRKISETTNDI